MSSKLNLLCVAVILFIQGVHPAATNNDVIHTNLVGDAQWVINQAGNMVNTVFSNEGTQKVVVEVVNLVKVWLETLNKKSQALFTKAKCTKNAIGKLIDSSESTVKSLFECKTKVLNTATTDAKNWTTSVQNYITNMATQIKGSITKLETCAKNPVPNLFDCTKLNLVDLYEKIKAKVQTIPDQLLTPGWAVIKKTANSIWDCKKLKWKDIENHFTLMKKEMGTCLST